MLNIKFLIRQIKFQINQKIILEGRTELLRKLLQSTRNLKGLYFKRSNRFDSYSQVTA